MRDDRIIIKSESGGELVSTSLFYSWQNDSDKKTNRNFIEAALKKAIKILNRPGFPGGFFT